MRYVLVCLAVTCLILVTGCPSDAVRQGPAVEPAETVARSIPAPALRFSPRCSGLPEDGMWKCDPVFADINGDCHLDLAAIVRQGNGSRVWLGNGRGEWMESASGLDPGQRSCGGGVGFGDLNGDGHLDLAVADHCDGVYVYLGDGAGTWEVTTEAMCLTDEVIADPAVEWYRGAEDIAVGDVNGDGFVDLVASSSYQNGISIYLGDGTGRNWRQRSNGLLEKGWANRVALADVNGDEALDVVAACGEGPRVWLNDGQGNYASSSDGLPDPVIQGIHTGIAVGDINEDGRVDIAVANWVDGPEVYLQQADGAWLKAPDVFPAMRGGAIGLALGDIDGDEHLDMAISGRMKLERGHTRGVFVLLGDGDGKWHYVANSGLPETGLTPKA